MYSFFWGHSSSAVGTGEDALWDELVGPSSKPFPLCGEPWFL